MNRVVFVPILVDADNLNAQLGNARAILEKWNVPAGVWQHGLPYRSLVMHSVDQIVALSVALRWPEESEKIETIIRDQDDYRHWVSQRWEEVFSPNGVEGVSDDRNHVAHRDPTR